MKEKQITKKINAVSAGELLDNVYTYSGWIIEDLLACGVYILAGAPKTGKSFFALQLAYCVSTGCPLWRRRTKKGATLYFALEDNKERLQQRFAITYGLEMKEQDNLFFATQAASLEEGFLQQLQEFVEEHHDLSLVIVDTLQIIRRNSPEGNAYAADYEVISSLKEFSQKNEICFLLVHHTRKKEAEDCFQRISGSNGLLGASDGAFLLTKESRTGNTATLNIVGRDVADQRLCLEFDHKECIWKLKKEELELWKNPPDPLLEKINLLLSGERRKWEGTATKLIQLCELETDSGLPMKANVLTRKLNVSCRQLLDDYGIEYRSWRGHERMIFLKRKDDLIEKIEIAR